MKADTEAEFRSFVAARWTRLVRTAYLLTGDLHEAEDLVQVTLEKLYTAWSRLGPDDRIDAYARRVLVNSNISRIRRRRLGEWLTTSPPERPATDAIAQADDRAALLSALATLPPKQRAAVVLRYWEDMSEAQVAEALGCSVGNVKSQTSRGLAKLRAHPELAGRSVGTVEGVA
jgi:RNA polymerase sigma-70 factor (sigma-E family)